MKCLWLTRKYPRPVNSGELIYSDGLIRSFAATGVDLTVIAHDNDEKPVGSGGEQSTFQDEQGVNWRLGSPELGGRFQSLFTKYPGDAWRSGKTAARRDLSKMPSRMKNGMQLSSITLRLAGQPGLSRKFAERWKINLWWPMFHTITKPKSVPRSLEIRPDPFPKSAALRYDAWKYAKLENHLCATCDLVTAITETEVAAYRENFPNQEYLCLTPGYDGFRAEDRVITEEMPRRAIMSGSFEWIAKRINLELFLEQAADKFHQAGIELQIVGKTDEEFKNAISAKFPSVSMVGRVS